MRRRPCALGVLQRNAARWSSRRAFHNTHSRWLHLPSTNAVSGDSHTLAQTHDDDALVLNIPRANVYRFGDANQVASPVFRDLDWKIREGESWAIISSAGNEKSILLETLLGYTRLSPSPPTGIYPFLTNSNPPRDPHSGCISLVSFTATRRASGGAFYDYTARYGAVRDEDRVTLREALFSEYEHAKQEKAGKGVNVDGNASQFDVLAERLDLTRLLDLPLIVLSNGQTRRARIARALLGMPDLLLLDEPLTGLDVQHRPKLTRLLGEIHSTSRPRVLMTLRPQDPIPDWITHIAKIEGQHVRTGRRPTMHQPAKTTVDEAGQLQTKKFPGTTKLGKVLVDMKNVNVRYHDRHVLKNVSWTIREGDRWHLKGPNGSGKTTLLSLLTGDHPQSHTQSSRSASSTSHLELFSSPRRTLPTTTLARLIGTFSPELYAAFPRRLGANSLTVRDTIATGFEGTFSYRPCTPEMDARIDELLEDLGPARWSGGGHTVKDVQFDKLPFAMLSPGEQGLVLLLRALAGKPPLLILDEVFAGMDSQMIISANQYLSSKLEPSQAAIFVTHWEEEVPWKGDSLQSINLDNGEITIS